VRLLRSGADPDLRTSDGRQTPRELAREMLQQMPDEASYRRIAEVMGIA